MRITQKVGWDDGHRVLVVGESHVFGLNVGLAMLVPPYRR